MILSIYLTLLGLALALLAFGLWKDKLPMQIVAYAFIFFLGLVLTNTQGPLAGTTGIEYKIGENTSYTYNSTTISATAQVDTYATYSNTFYGWLIAITAVGMIFIIVTDPKVKLT